MCALMDQSGIPTEFGFGSVYFGGFPTLLGKRIGSSFCKFHGLYLSRLMFGRKKSGEFGDRSLYVKHLNPDTNWTVSGVR